MSDLSLGSEFEETDESAWRALVDKALKGAEFEKKLVKKTYDGVRLDPLYTGAGGAPDSGVPGAAPYTRGFRATVPDRPWVIHQLIADADPGAANEAVRADLECGVSSLSLQIAAPGQFGIAAHSKDDLARVLDGVQLDSVPVSLMAGARAPDAVQALIGVWEDAHVSPDKAAGAFNLDPLGTLARAGELPVAIDQALGGMAQFVKDAANFGPQVTVVGVDVRPYHDGGAGEAQELACLCATLVAYLRALDGAGVAPVEALRRTTFVLAADTDQFLTIAKLRAARALIARIAEVSDAADALDGVTVNVTSSQRMLARRDPWVNLLRTTMACAAAALGGADSITVLPFTWSVGQPDAFARRLARNIHIILQEESWLGAVADPAGGSWYVESVTQDLAEKAWSLFQEIEQQGGMMEALASGRVQGMIAETAEARERAAATARDELTGVNAYPDLAKSMPEVAPHPVAEQTDDPAITVEPVPLRRPAEPFDRLREAADAQADRTGAPPAIFLATLGKLSEFGARATYTRNFFAAGGIDNVGGEPYATAEAAAEAFKQSGATVACICSSDPNYAEMAADTAAALSKAGAANIFLAGRPGELREALTAAGVNSFIHIGCDMLGILRQSHEWLGIKA